MTEAAKAEVDRIMEDCISRLREHVDCVQILASNHDEDGTTRFSAGLGNWYARAGQAQEWLRFDDERDRCRVRKDEEQD